LHAANIAVAADEEEVKKFEHPVGKTLIAEPGKYLVRYTIRLGSIRSNDFPGKDDWQGELVTGETPVALRARTAADDARERAGNFTGRIEFVGKDGKQIKEGTATYRTANTQAEATRITIHAGPLDIPDCSSKPLTIGVRAPGYEEALYHDVQLKAGETKRFELTPALPARFRVVTMAGKPIAGATVRHFNKTSDKASGGPYPTSGLKGTIVATSQADGTVVLDTLQKTDPYYATLGDALYFFYVEAAGMAGQFVGGVKAGQDLGEVKLSPPLEVRGEVRGSAAELERFAAEWDQPFELKTANPTARFAYAVSEKLTTKKDGDKLTFHLTGLRPGKLRFVCNFSPPPHKVSHTYGKRDAKGSDIEIEFEVKENMTNVIITPAGRQTAAKDGRPGGRLW
jgi:hypothetical protein